MRYLTSEVADTPSTLIKEPAMPISRSFGRLARPLLLGWLLASILVSTLWTLGRTDELLDMASFLHSGRSYALGLNPYEKNEGVKPVVIGDSINLNPPISVYGFQVLSEFDPLLVRRAMLILSVGILVIVGLLLWKAYPEPQRPLQLVALVSTAGIFQMLYYGQLYAPLVLAAAGSWLLLRDGRWLLAGVLFGFLIALKPTFIIVPGFLFLAGHRRVAYSTFAGSALISLIPLLVDGTEIYRQWFEAVGNVPGLQWTANTSLASLTARMGTPLPGYGLAAIALTAVAAWAWRTRPDALEVMAAGLISVLLTGPMIWVGYTLFLLPWLLSRSWPRGVWVAVLLLSVPLPIVREMTITHGASTLENAIVGSTYAWAVVILALAFGRNALPPPVGLPLPFKEAA